MSDAACQKSMACWGITEQISIAPSHPILPLTNYAGHALEISTFEKNECASSAEGARADGIPGTLCRQASSVNLGEGSMHGKDFGLARRPYPATPDRAYYYPATGHEQALDRLLHALQDDEGFALLTGLPGTGKTLLCHCLLDRLDGDVECAFLTNGHYADRLGLLQAILYEFSLPYESGEQVLRLRLTEQLLKNCEAGKRTILLVDEAQHLSIDLLEELRLLGNLEAGQGKAFQVVLVGQPKLLETLKRPQLTALGQRVVVRTQLEPFCVEEGVDYLLHHVRVAGGKPEDVWEEPALEVLARGAGGVPRLLNQVAHHALTLARQAEMSRVDAEAALEALANLGLSSEDTAANPIEETSVPIRPAVALDLSDAEDRASVAALEGDDVGCRLFDSPRSA